MRVVVDSRIFNAMCWCMALHSVRALVVNICVALIDVERFLLIGKWVRRFYLKKGNAF